MKNRDDATLITNSEYGELVSRMNELERVLRNGVAVVNDFLPNIGRCALQDYGRMNMFLVDARKLIPNLNSDPRK